MFIRGASVLLTCSVSWACLLSEKYVILLERRDGHTQSLTMRDVSQAPCVAWIQTRLRAVRTGGSPGAGGCAEGRACAELQRGSRVRWQKVVIYPGRRGGERRCPGRKEPCTQALTGWEQKQWGIVPSSFTLDEHLLCARRQTAQARRSSCSGAAGTNLSAMSMLSPGCALPRL